MLDIIPPVAMAVAALIIATYILLVWSPRVAKL